MKRHEDNGSFWLSYSDLMTSMFFIMLVLFIVCLVKVSISYKQLQKSINEGNNTEALLDSLGKKNALLESEIIRLTVFKNKYEEILSIYKAVDNIDPEYFEFNKEYLKHIFKIQVTYQTGQFSLNKLREDANWSSEYNPSEAQRIRQRIIDAGNEIKQTIINLQRNGDIKSDIKYLVVIEGQASADGYHKDDNFNNDVLSYQRALKLHEFWRDQAGIDFTKMEKCELVIAGSGEKGVPRAPRINLLDDSNNQRFLIHIVPVIGDIRLVNN